MKLLSHLAGYAPVNIASALASFGGVYVFTRLMGAESYGIYSLMIWALAVIHTISLTWVEAANYRFTGEFEVKGNKNDHFRTALSLMGRSILLALLLAGGLWLALRGKPEYARIVPWIALLLPLNTIIQMALEAHKAGQRVGRFAFVETSRLLIGFALGAIFCWALGWGAAGPFIGLAVAGALLAMKEGPWLLKQASGGKTDAARRKAWLGYGAPIAAALLLDLIVSGIDRPMIAMFHGEAMVGEYAAGYGVADKTVLLICAWAAMAGSPLVMAAYEKGGADAAREQARGLARTLLMLGLPAATGLALVAEPLASAMIGENVRAGAVKIIPWIAFAGLLNGLLIHYFSEAFQLAKKTSLRAILMLVPAISNIVLNLALIPQFELMGAVAATLASYLIGIILLAGAGRKYVALPVPMADFFRVALACLAMWPVIYLMPELGGIGAGWPELLLKCMAGGITYVIMALGLDAGGARAFMRNRLSSEDA